MNYFNGDGYGKGCFIIFILFFVGIIYSIAEFAAWIMTPKDFIVTKDMIPTKRIVTDGVSVDTVLVYKIK